jgi:hypothetical protein
MEWATLNERMLIIYNRKEWMGASSYKSPRKTASKYLQTSDIRRWKAYQREAKPRVAARFMECILRDSCAGFQILSPFGH